jgi:hypothetical protein
LTTIYRARRAARLLMADFVAEVGDDGLGGWRELPRQSDPVDGAMVIHAGADPRNANWLERARLIVYRCHQ